MPASAETFGDRDHVDVTCPHCGPHRRSRANQKRKVMRIWTLRDGTQSFSCARCGARGLTGTRRLDPTFPAKARSADVPPEERMRLAQTLWQSARPIAGTAADRYLRGARGYGGAPPPTLRYLPASGAHAHTMIAAFGIAPELSCGELRDPEKPRAIHLTRLKPDASGRLDKIMIGPVSGNPIVLAPANDGLGLVIAEGIEDALSLHEATGLGAWAAGSAAHMAKLAAAVHSYVTCVTVAQDDDEAGRTATNRLGAALIARGLEVRIFSLAQAP